VIARPRWRVVHAGGAPSLPAASGVIGRTLPELSAPPAVDVETLPERDLTARSAAHRIIEKRVAAR